MINTQHKLSEKEHGKVEYKKNKVFKIKKEKITSEKV
jgi:hypothetical protein